MPAKGRSVDAMITQTRVRELFRYDENAGILTRRITTSPNARVGMVAGYRNSLGYLEIRIDGHLYLAHRLAWLYVHGCWPSLIDHVDGDPSNNRLSNLREATWQQNQANKKIHKNNKSGFKGVVRVKRSKEWLANIRFNKKTMYLGLFNTPEAAHEAYLEAARRLFGEYARAA